MRFELFLALRYLFARRAQAFISVISWVAVGGVALGVASLIVVMGVMNGFTTDLRDKIIGMTSHAIVYSNLGPIADDPALLQGLAQSPGIAGATPFVQSGIMVSSLSGSSGVYLRGVDPDSAATVLGGLKNMTLGAVSDLKREQGLPGIIMGETLADRLAVHIGSRVNLMAPSGQLSSAGHTPRIRSFQVVGLFSMGLSEYDGTLVFVTMDRAWELLGWRNQAYSGIEVSLEDVDKAKQSMGAALAAIERRDLYAETWMDMHGNLFAALKLEKAAMAVILILVVLMGSFPIVTALVMLVMEKTRDIAVLMSMGACKASIRKIFMIQGLVIGFMGTSLGFVLGLGVAFLLKHYKFIELPRGVYSLDYLPVLLQGPDLVLTAVSAMLICFLATLYPAGQAAALEPVDALRHE
ncbi:lipoprotein-releasing ABC transporter permease subunit [Desulfovibrio sp. OttesenSCG-928-A18]|nr:lipoprotein-releasing ABC transporter permease subunit [Desulfovibrio sp. OttesenSCG-928-A18]